MICPTCDRETAAVSELGEMGGRKLRKRCAHPDCKAALPEEQPARQLPATAVQAITSGDPARKSAPPQNGAPPTFAQILEQFEQRLPYVRERIAELRAFEAEERQLVAALSAAGRASTPENKPS